MPPDEDEVFTMYAMIGVCLLCVQQAEHVLAGAVELVFRDPKMTADKLTEMTEQEQTQTLGKLLGELGKRTLIEPTFYQELRRFLRARNRLVHNLSEVHGWNLRTEEGREAATKFLLDLATLALRVTGVFMSVFSVSAKEDYGKELLGDGVSGGRQLLSQQEAQFGAIARKILAGRNLKPRPVRDGNT